MRLPQLWRNLRIITLTAAFSIYSDILLSYLRRFLLVTRMTFFLSSSHFEVRVNVEDDNLQAQYGWIMKRITEALKPKYSLCRWNLAWRRLVMKQLNRSLVSGLKVAAQSNDG